MPSLTPTPAAPLAQLLYNDASPMENHHASRSMTLLLDKQYNFLLRAPQVRPVLPHALCVVLLPALSRAPGARVRQGLS